MITEKAIKSLILLALLFSFLPAAIADVPQTLKPNAEVVAFGLQAVRADHAQYVASVPHSPDDKILKSTAKAALLAPDHYAQEPVVSFVLHPYTLILPGTPPKESKKNDITAYGQPINLNNSDFAEFLSSLSPCRKRRYCRVQL